MEASNMPRVLAGTGSAQLALYSCGVETDPQPNANYIIDVSGLRDPLSNRGFRYTHNDGRALDVQKFVEEDPRIDAIRQQVAILAYLHFGGRRDAPWMSLAFRDHHGKWISPAVTELMAESLSNMGYAVSVHHFALEGGEK
jgi:hypothetical protein